MTLSLAIKHQARRKLAVISSGAEGCLALVVMESNDCSKSLWGSLIPKGGMGRERERAQWQKGKEEIHGTANKEGEQEKRERHCRPRSCIPKRGKDGVRPPGPVPVFCFAQADLKLSVGERSLFFASPLMLLADEVFPALLRSGSKDGGGMNARKMGDRCADARRRPKKRGSSPTGW